MANSDNKNLHQFGFNDPEPWALDALRLLFSVPRTYSHLMDAWDERFPGSKKATDRLVSAGLVEFQQGVIIDTRTGKAASKLSRPLPRYRATAKGRRLSNDAKLDERVLFDAFRRLTPAQAPKLVKLLAVLDLEQPHARFGLSAPHAVSLSGLPERSGRWWIQRLLEDGLVVQLPEELADVRELVPPHWRVTRELCKRVSKALDGSEMAKALSVEFRLQRSRFLGSLDPARVGVSGATDFDHDVETQRVLAALLRSQRCLPSGAFMVEPRITLTADTRSDPWLFDANGAEMVFYQPDVELRERDERTGGVRRMVIEYERFQSRRDAWSHIERFLGWLHLRSLPFEGATLRFVVDTEPRVRSYVTLIEAFADQALDNPDRLPGNPVQLAVTSVQRLISAADPLDPKVWFRINIPGGAETGTGRPVLHNGASPYDDYFARGSE
jgi:hypothetical protein